MKAGKGGIWVEQGSRQQVIILATGYNVISSEAAIFFRGSGLFHLEMTLKQELSRWHMEAGNATA